MQMGLWCGQGKIFSNQHQPMPRLGSGISSGEEKIAVAPLSGKRLGMLKKPRKAKTSFPCEALWVQRRRKA